MMVIGISILIILAFFAGAASRESIQQEVNHQDETIKKTIFDMYVCDSNCNICSSKDRENAQPLALTGGSWRWVCDKCYSKLFK